MESAATRPSTSRRVLAGVVLALPLFAGAAYAAATHLDPSDTWAPAEETAGAPASSSLPELAAARRAAMDAGAKSSLLIGGTKQLADGSKQLVDGTGQVDDGTGRLRGGAEQLADGMNQLQAATGQLGDGAKEMADGIDQAAGQLGNLEAIRGQIITAIDDTVKEIGDSPDPRAEDLKKNLAGLREQAQNFKLDQASVDQLQRLRDGSRELANQLDSPGYGFHDGIYEATKGSKDLAEGLRQLADGTGQLRDGAKRLDEGAQKVDGLAKATNQGVKNAQRALPVTPTAGMADTSAEVPSRTFAPMYAFLLAAGLMLAAGLGSWARTGGSLRGRASDGAGDDATSRGRRGTLAFSAVTFFGAALTAGLLAVWLSNGGGLVLGVIAAGIALLTCAVAAAGTAAVQRLFGATVGKILAAVGLFAQVACVGWIWNTGTTSELAPAARVIGGLLPLHYPTAALSATGNDVGTIVVALSVVVLVALLGAALLVLRLVPGAGAEARPEGEAPARFDGPRHAGA